MLYDKLKVPRTVIVYESKSSGHVSEKTKERAGI